jgi:hypothetical protein
MGEPMGISDDESWSRREKTQPMGNEVVRLLENFNFFPEHVKKIHQQAETFQAALSSGRSWKDHERSQV